LLERQANELVRLPVDVIVTAQVPAVRIAKKATATIPIVMVAAADPVGAGLIPNFARPGGNLTGLSILTTDLAAKRLQLLGELALPVLRGSQCLLGTLVDHPPCSPKPKQRDGCWVLKYAHVSLSVPPICRKHLPR
jgi:hypothetical protein